MTKALLGGLAIWAIAVALSPSLAGQAASERPVYGADGKLQRPDGYREWVFLSSGLGMNYGPNAPAPGQPRNYTNVFVNPSSYRAFMATGKWPEQTTFVLEIRRAATQASIDIGGVSQTDRITIEVEVKDSERFKASGGWGFFDFTGGPSLLPAASQLPSDRSCYSCHRTNTAVENTFVQFYPDLMDVARRLGTVKPGYDPNHKIQ